ncbi:MAG: phosphoribosylformylglycinamidine synthase I [Candidatus Gracilibacteria bacterium]|nr:phosphoribosylformylglycinamidine synthase I [Candidatus Gracilibacteria bacterium]
MKRIAILQFPGINSEYETKRAVDDAGMEGVIFRWNESPVELAAFDGFIVPGGFAYEDRGRAGLIASLDSIMDVIRSEVAKGKPLLGICNGAQIVVETCMVPGDGKLELCLANNKRIKDGEIVGTGFINFDVTLRATASPGRCAFNIGIESDSLHYAPIAHGEGRFTTTNLETLSRIENNDQIIFKYCDANGEVVDNYPINPNGAFKNAAAICNEAGNVMAIMPHPERAFSAPIPEVFTSMRTYLEEYYDKGKAMIPETATTHKSDYSRLTLAPFHNRTSHFEILVDLIITDNTAETFTNTLNLMGFEVSTKRQTHYTVFYDESSKNSPLEMATLLISSGELLNTNKEFARVKIGEKTYQFNPNSGEIDELFTPLHKGVLQLYSKDREDFFGQSKTEKIQKHLVGKNPKCSGFKFVVQGVLWTVDYLDSTIPEDHDANIDALLKTNIFANPHSQELLKYSGKNLFTS